MCSVLVHGPLTVTLMAHELQSHVRNNSDAHTPTAPLPRLLSFTYRNLSPLLCGEPLYIGVRREDAPPPTSVGVHSTTPSDVATATAYTVSVWSAQRQLAATADAVVQF
jgi:hydroxyacyl-ACP dehydratase HTD2-like protein with hotdog domain